MAAHATIRDVLDFWFLPLDHPDHGRPRALWWQPPAGLDGEIRHRFAATVEAALDGELEAWRQSPDGALAHIVLCDQFPRNIHRGSARAFTGDARALATARLALARCYPASFGAPLRLFFYMPFQHSEAIADQELACALFAALDDAEALRHAEAHRDIVARFGRFPHRNDALGRTSTGPELDYLRTAKRFGQ